MVSPVMRVSSSFRVNWGLFLCAVSCNRKHWTIKGFEIRSVKHQFYDTEIHSLPPVMASSNEIETLETVKIFENKKYNDCIRIIATVVQPFQMPSTHISVN